MIVFIAMVIVAAVAAAVLINTAGGLQRKAGETGQETTQEVSGNIFVRDIVGNVTDETGKIDEIEWYVSLAPGAEPVDMQNLVVRYEHGSNLFDFLHVNNEDEASAGDGDATQCQVKGGGLNFSTNSSAFCVNKVLDVGDDDKNVLSEGDRAKIRVTLEAGPEDAEVPTRATVSTLLIPEKGTPIDAGFKTPATFQDREHISLK